MKNYKKLLKLVKTFNDEFDSLNGRVTCEFAIYKDNLDLMEKVLTELPKIKHGVWVVTECETCVGYHGEGFYHASLEMFDNLEDYMYYEKDNIIRIFKIV